ncbi:MAG: hypothetical protein JNJ78_14665 [Anaerolineae bacterium]|jgi:hypothetical protein|nr:hypothetical protein [Anaerolineae bacterium]
MSPFDVQHNLNLSSHEADLLEAWRAKDFDTLGRIVGKAIWEEERVGQMPPLAAPDDARDPQPAGDLVDVPFASYADLWLQGRQLAEQADAAIRGDRARRLAMLRLVDELFYLLGDVTFDVLHQRGEATGAFAEEEEADHLLWMLTEFLTRAELPRLPGEEATLRSHQLNERFARSWFDLVGE